LKIVLTAVPGAGKTTIIRRIEEAVEGIETVNFGDAMFEAAREEYGIENRDLMRNSLSPEDYRRVQASAARKIAQKVGDVIVDTHCSILTPRGYYPGLPEEVVKLLEPDVVVLIEYDPEVIAARRAKDIESSERTGREIETAKRIELQQQMNRCFAAAYATLARATVRIISLREKEQYDFEHAEKASREIAELFE